MANKTYAQEWLMFATKNLSTAELLYNANHYEDITREEIREILDFTQRLFERVCNVLEINKNELIC